MKTWIYQIDRDQPWELMTLPEFRVYTRRMAVEFERAVLLLARGLRPSGDPVTVIAGH